MRQLNDFLSKLVYTYSNNLFLIVIPLALLFLAVNSLLFLIVYLLVMIYYFIKKRGIIFYTIVVLSIIIFIILLINNKIYDCNRYQNEEINIEGVVIDYQEYESSYGGISYRYTLKTRFIKDKVFICKKKIYCYLKDYYEIGDNINIKGTVKEIDGEKIEHSFDYETYLNHNKIYLVINGEESYKVSTKLSISKFKQLVNNYFSKHFEGETLIVLKGLILGDSSGFSDSFNNALKENGILHLFAVSGLHITLFITMLGGILKLIKLKEEWIERIIIVFLSLYLVITSFSVSIVRASLMYFFGIINKRLLNKLFSSLDVISFTFIILLLINPYYAYNTGFILSFMVSFIIVLVSSLLRDKSNAFQILVISILSNLFTVPVIININYEYNLLTPVLNVLYINLVSLFILPFGFICLVLPILSYAYDYIIQMFINLIDFTSNISLSIKFPYFNYFYILLFYGCLIGIILFIAYKRMRRIFILILGLTIIYLLSFSNYNYNPQIDFLYLNDGESTIISYKNQVIVIDTGDGNNNEVRNALLSKGIRRIDYLVITHSHDDHYGGVEGIIEKIKVRHFVTSVVYSYNYDNQLRVKPLDIIRLNDIEMIFLSPSASYSEENANSLTLLLTIKNKRFLFLGDSTTEEEKEVVSSLKQIGIKNIDCIKIAHHGSDTSNGEELLNYVKVDYAIIMVGILRKQTHPSSEVVQRLNDKGIKTYITTNCYSIGLKIKGDRLIFNTLKNS